jgi:haloalkane dehalogenase
MEATSAIRRLISAAFHYAEATLRTSIPLDLGPGIFMLMEDNPHEMRDGIVKWFKAKVA